MLCPIPAPLERNPLHALLLPPSPTKVPVIQPLYPCRYVRRGTGAAVSLLLLLLAGFMLPSAALAQILFAGAQETLFSQSSSDSLSPIAVDSNGDAFFVTSNGTTTRLMEVSAGGSTSTINSSFPSVPTAIAVNPAGTTLYFIYYGSTTNCSGGSVFIATAPVSTGVPVNMPCSFSIEDGVTPFTVKYSNPTGLAVDPSGNLWIADEGGGDFFEILAPVSATSVPAKIAALTLGQPWDIAVNGNGEVYFTLLKPSGSSEIQEVADIPASSFTNNLDNDTVAASAIVTHVPSIESGLILDSSGHIFLGGGDSADSEVIGSALISVDEDFVNGTEGLAADSNGNLYIAGADTTGTQYVVELNRFAASFGSVAVEQTGNPLTLNFIIENITVGSIGVLTMGQANQDFATASGTTCTAHAYTSVTTCIVNVTFTPMAPGLRTGALVFYSGANQTGNVLASVPLYGTGTGPELAYYPGTLIAIDPTVNTLQLKYPVAVAVDGAGDLYIADYSNNRVVKVPAGGGTATSIDPSVNGKTLAGPEGVALDGAGDLFICDAGNRRVVEVAIDGTLTAIDPVVNATGLNGDAAGIGVDGAGDLFIADQYNNRVVEVPAGGGTPIAIDPTVNGKAVGYPVAVAVDAAGDLFIADYLNSRVVEVPPGGGTPTAIAPAPNGQALDGVVGVAVDAAGDLYISNFFTSQIVEVPADGSAPTAIDTFVNGSSVFGPQNIAVDTAGNLFIADYESWRIVEVQHSVPPTLNFPTPTLVGSTDTADGPQTAQIVNIGNSALTFHNFQPIANPGYPAAFPENIGQSNLCTDVSYLPDASCYISAEFMPGSAGTNYASIVLTYDEFNGNEESQFIPVTGANNQQAQTINFTPPASPVNYGVSPITLVATGGASGNAVVFTIDASSTGTGSISGNMLTVTGVGSLVIDANQAGNTTYAPAPQVQELLVVNAAPQIISFPAPASPVNYGVSPITLAATGGTSSNPVVFSVVSGQGTVSGTNGTTLTITGVGTVVVAANQAGSFDYAAATQATQSIVVNAAPQTISFPAPASPVTFPVSPITLAATGGASGNPVVFSVVSGPGTVSGTNGTTLTITDSGTVVVAANQAGSANYTAAPQVTRTIVVNPPARAILISPTPGSTLTGSSATFIWSPAQGATQYELRLGTTGPGSSDVYNSAEAATTSLTTGLVSGIPTYGAPLYARLYSKISGAWQYNDYTYTESGTPVPAVLITPPSPTPESTLTGSSATFSWTAGGDVTQYEFRLGTTKPGSSDVYNSADAATNSLTTGLISGIPTNGVTLYARLYSKINGAWQWNDYTYTEATPLPAVLIVPPSPAPGSTLAGSSATFSWSAGVGVTQYEFRLGTTVPGSSDVYNSADAATTSLTTGLVSGIPTNGVTLYARLYSKINGAWQYIDYTYTEAP